MRLSFLVGTSAVALSLGCGAPTAPAYAVELSLTDSVIARRSQNEVSLTIQVRAQNRDTKILYYEQCGHSLQRREGNSWRTVDYTFCPANFPYSFAISPGGSALFTLTARAPTSATEWPATGAPGEYRVVLWLTAVPRNQSGFPPQPLPLENRTSSVFSVREVVVVL
jgi:hypothetical protein